MANRSHLKFMTLTSTCVLMYGVPLHNGGAAGAGKFSTRTDGVPSMDTEPVTGGSSVTPTEPRTDVSPTGRVGTGELAVFVMNTLVI